MSNGKSFGCLSMLLVVLLGASLLLNFGLLATRISDADRNLPRLEEELLVPATGKTADKIAVIPVRGLISFQHSGPADLDLVEETKLALAQAVRDEKVKAVVLEIDSPGGEVTASDAIYQAVRAARKSKPVVVFMQSLAASGGYYIACGGSWLMAHETTITGSIGVLIQTLKYHGLLGKVGVEAVTFRSGKFKDILSPLREMTDEEKQIIQGLVMETYEKFVGIVAEARKMPVDTVRSGPADGRIMSGRSAREAGLIDATGRIEDAYAKARELGRAPGAAVVRYQRGLQFSRLFRFLGQDGAAARIALDLPQGALPQLEPGRLYLLPAWFAL